jgi:hypothetical protein
VNGQNTASFAVEIDFTTLDAGSKQSTLAYFDNRSSHSKTVGMKQPTDTDPITNVELKHSKIIGERHRTDKMVFVRH